MVVLMFFMYSLMSVGCEDLFDLRGCHVSEGILYFRVQLSNGIFRVNYEFVNVVFGVLLVIIVTLRHVR